MNPIINSPLIKEQNINLSFSYFHLLGIIPFMKKIIIRLTDISDKFRIYTREWCEFSEQNHLKRILEGEFIDTIHFINVANSRLTLYLYRLPMSKLVIDYVHIYDKLLHLENSMGDIVTKSGIHIRNDIDSLDARGWHPQLDVLYSVGRIPKRFIILQKTWRITQTAASA